MQWNRKRSRMETYCCRIRRINRNVKNSLRHYSPRKVISLSQSNQQVSGKKFRVKLKLLRYSSMHLLIVVYLCLLISVNGLNPLVIKGYKIFDAVTGSPVFVKGVDYYPRPNHGTLNVNNYDFYTKAFQHVWENDIKHFKRMGITAVRLYAVDPSKTHDQFMAALSNSGIYAVIGLAARCVRLPYRKYSHIHI